MHGVGPHDALQLKAALREIGSKQVLPVNTEHANLLAKFMDNLKKK